MGGVGKIYIRKTKDAASLVITKIKDLTTVIIPHFTKFQLQTQKRLDFELCTQIMKCMNNKEHLTSDGLLKILSLKSALNRGLSKSTNKIKNIEFLERPLYLVDSAEFKKYRP